MSSDELAPWEIEDAVKDSLAKKFKIATPVKPSEITTLQFDKSDIDYLITVYLQRMGVDTEIYTEGGELFQETVRYIVRSSVKPNPLAAIATAIACIGTVIGGGSYQTGAPTNWSNYYILVLGSSGRGKTEAISCGQTLLGYINPDFIGDSTITSASGLAARLAYKDAEDSNWPRFARCLYTLDEFDDLCKQMNQERENTKTGVGRLLKTLWSKPWSPKYNRGVIDTKYRWELDWHNLSIVGSATNKSFLESCTSKNVTDGFLTRWLIFDATDEAEEAAGIRITRQTPVHAGLPEDLIKEYSKLANMYLRGKRLTGALAIKERTLPYNDDAARFLRALNLEYDDKRPPEPASFFVSRTLEHAQKLTLVRAASERLDAATEITVEDLSWALKIAEYSEATITKMLPIVDESNLSKIRRVMVEIIEKYSVGSKHGTCPASKIRYELPRRCKRELQRDIGYYINDAKEAGIIDVLGSETRQVCRVVPEDERERRLDEIEKEAYEFTCKAEEAARKTEESGGNVWGKG